MSDATHTAPAEVKNDDPDRLLKQMRLVLDKNTNSKILSMMGSCVQCGLCADACHYYVSTGDPDYIPAARLQKFQDVLNAYFHPVKSRLPFLKGSKDALNQKVNELYKEAFESCTICGKCALHCPMGIHTGEAMLLARSMLSSIGKLPSGLDEPVRKSMEEGNYVGLTPEDFIENMEWIGEEMEEDIGVEGFRIPIDKMDANVLFIPHPLEIRDIPFLLMYYIKIMHAAGENFTFSSQGFDTVNYAYYQGNKDNMLRISQRPLKARKMLRAASIVCSPCGHGYRAMRWEAEKMLGRRHDFPILSFVELVDRYVREGRIRLKKDVYEGPITYHDPCNIGRRGGIIEAPRNILRALSTQFVEMEPHGAANFCCGGGGGLASTGTFGQTRMQAGKAKAEQIRKTGAKIVVTGCFNCLTQIRGLNETYNLGIEPKNFAELVAGSLVPG
ncbi:MAG: (Fe-S)-binding protein [Thermodesulfobacteriota bacterium]